MKICLGTPKTSTIMHEAHIFKNMLAYLEGEEDATHRKIKKICVTFSEFGGMKEGHFIEHCREAFAGTRWEALDIEVKKIPYGPEFEITKIEFAL